MQRPSPPHHVSIVAACLAAMLATTGVARATDRPHDPASHAAGAAAPIAVSSLGGALQDAQQKAFFVPFTTATHVPVHLGSWDGLLATLQTRARTDAPHDRDLVLMENSSVLVACQQGLFQPLDPSVLPGLSSSTHQVESDAISRCGLGAFRTDLVLAFDKSRSDNSPGWADFWDVARRPGKRGLRRDPRGTLEIALLADGVAPDDIYRTLGSKDGLDRAFRKLDQLKPYIVWWDSPVQAVQIIESGAVLMTSVPNGEVAAANLVGHRDFGIQWLQSLSVMLSWAVPGRPAPAGAVTAPSVSDRMARVAPLLAFMDDPARQVDFISRYQAVSLMQDVPAPGQALPEDSPVAPDHARNALRQDDAFWLGHLAAVRTRFDGWLGQ